MDVGERKALHDEHTILVPGPDHEIKVVKEMFRLYIEEKRSMPYIARLLNDLGILHGKVTWNYQAVRKILFGEKYSGSLVWRQYTQRLRSPYVRLPQKDWVIARDVTAPVVDRSTFDAARRVWSNRTKQFSDAQYLGSLRMLRKTSGRLSARLINESPITPSSSSYVNRFAASNVCIS